MTCQEAQRFLLLEDSGELPAETRGELEKHVEGCDACRTYREMLEELRRQVSAGGAGEGPSDEVLAAIRAEAVREARRRGRFASVVFSFPRAAALAAGLALLLAAGAVLRQAERTRERERIGEAHALVTAVIDTNTDVPSEGADLESLAEALLVMEGFAGDDDFEIVQPPSDAGEEPTSGGVHPSTDLQGRSRNGLPVRRYG